MRGRPFSRVVIEESKEGVRVIFYSPFLRWFWRRRVQKRYQTFAACLLGLSEGYLEAAKLRGAAGRKQRRRLARKIAAKLVG